MATVDDIADRATGCLVGQLVGDALGTRYEFSSSHDAKACISRDMINRHLAILGDGPFHVVPGQVTDDSELALGLATSLAEQQAFNLHDIAQKYMQWYHSPPFDIGRTIHTALGNTSLKKTAEQNYHAIVKSSLNNAKSLSNGSLMRISPLAIVSLSFHESEHYETVVRNRVKLECELTHPHPVVVDAATVYVFALQSAMHSGDVYETCSVALKTAKTPLVLQILTDALTQPEPVVLNLETSERGLTDSVYQGYLGIALQNAFYELLHTPNFEDALVNIISRGGDTDTNACIAGSLFGAIYGFGGIPTDWVNTVLYANVENRSRQYPLARVPDVYQLVQKLVQIPLL